MQWKIKKIIIFFVLIIVVFFLKFILLDNNFFVTDKKIVSEEQQDVMYKDEDINLYDIFSEKEYKIGDIKYVTPLSPLYDGSNPDWEFQDPYSTKDKITKYNNKISIEDLKIIISSKSNIIVKSNDFEYSVLLNDCTDQSPITATFDYMSYPEENILRSEDISLNLLMCNNNYRVKNNTYFVQIIEIYNDLYFSVNGSDNWRNYIMSIE